MLPIFFVTLLFPLLLPFTAGERSVVLDQETDLYISWKLRGSYVYYPNGHLLGQIQEILPRDFDLKSMSLTNGIWAILPQRELNSTATFAFSSISQLMSGVRVTYSMGGRARIMVKKGSAGPAPVYTISPSDTPAYELVSLSIPFPASSQFTIEGHVEGPGSFILIDRIQGFYSDVTPRPNPSRPKKPKATSVAASLTPTMTLTLVTLLNL